MDSASRFGLNWWRLIRNGKLITATSRTAAQMPNQLSCVLSNWTRIDATAETAARQTRHYPADGLLSSVSMRGSPRPRNTAPSIMAADAGTRDGVNQHLVLIRTHPLSEQFEIVIVAGKGHDLQLVRAIPAHFLDIREIPLP